MQKKELFCKSPSKVSAKYLVHLEDGENFGYRILSN